MSVDLQLPDALKSYLEKQVASRGYKDVSEFLVDLIEADKHRQVGHEVEQLLLEGLESPSSPWTDQDMEDIRRVGEKLIERRRRR